MRTATNEALDALTAELVPAEETLSGNAAWKKYEAGWRPRLGPAQQRAYLNQRAKYFLLDGERGLGKTVGALNMMVDLCFLNLNATGFIIVREVGQSKDGGAWDKLINFTLPRWQDGNRNPKTGERYGWGIGLEFSAESHDYETKKPYVWLTNRFGGSSKIISFSLPVGAQVEDKVKGKEASFILVDEAQTCQSDDYFTWLIQQAGRKHDIEGEQPVVYCKR